ncbi:MAG: EamA family transporter [Gammaproteobacteria bacterium]|nr:EamA family transporter [Gammaproteobacteria bacterium]
MATSLLSSLSSRSIGIFSLLGSVALLTGSDSIIKWLSPHYALHEIMLFRAGFALIIIMAIVYIEGGIQVLRTRRPVLHALRGLLFVLANMFFFLGLANMPLADAVAVFFAAPIFICLLSKPILGEEVGFYRWMAIVAGMVGVIIMLRPGHSTFTVSAVLPLLAAFTYACLQMLTRKLGGIRKSFHSRFLHSDNVHPRLHCVRTHSRQRPL